MARKKNSNRNSNSKNNYPEVIEKISRVILERVVKKGLNVGEAIEGIIISYFRELTGKEPVDVRVLYLNTYLLKQNQQIIPCFLNYIIILGDYVYETVFSKLFNEYKITIYEYKLTSTKEMKVTY